MLFFLVIPACDAGRISVNCATLVLSLIWPRGWVVIEDIVYAAIPLGELVSMALPASYASYLIRSQARLMKDRRVTTHGTAGVFPQGGRAA